MTPLFASRQLIRQWEEAGSWPERSRMEEELAGLLNQLVLHDFGGLVQLLYQIDVPEARLKEALQQGEGQDAGRLMAALVLDRLAEKRRTRALFPKRGDIPGDEIW